MPDPTAGFDDLASRSPVFSEQPHDARNQFGMQRESRIAIGRQGAAGNLHLQHVGRAAKIDAHRLRHGVGQEFGVAGLDLHIGIALKKVRG